MREYQVNVNKPFHRDHPRPTIDCGPGLTEQAHAKQCDMNYILRDYQRTGLIKHAAKNQGRYDDVTGADFQEAMNTVTAAQQLFDGLPANIRKRFGNSPEAFLDFCSEPGNSQEMQKLGILQGNDGLTADGTPSGAPVAPNPTPEPPAPE